MSIKLILLLVALFRYNNGLLNDARCAPGESIAEDAKASVNNLCREAKIENDAPNNADFVFTYQNSSGGIGFSYGDGGYTAASSARNFPGLIGHNIAMTVVYLKACGLNLPHTHPRASTISYVAKGTIRCGFWTENTGQFHSFILNEGQGIAFGPGAIHFEQNIGCDDAVLVAAFNNEDPGTAQLTKSIISLPLDILAATFGQSENQINKTRLNYPNTPAKGVQSCYKACKINNY